MIKRKRIGNQGFSIVEAMAAIVILSIIFIPITNSFISSVKASQETKIMQVATNTAQQIMEDFKQDSIVNLAGKYNLASPIPAVWTKLDMQKSVSKAENDCCDFTVDISVSKIASTSSPASGVNEVNNVELPQVYSMEASSSAVLNVGEIPYVISDKILGKGMVPSDETDLRNKLKNENVIRKIIIDITEDSSTSNTNISCKQEFRSSGTTHSIDVKNMCMSTKLKNMYIYAKALYENGVDEIEIKNTARVSANVYIIYDLDSYKAKIVDESDETNLKFISNVPLFGKVYKSASTDAQYISGKKKEARRYEVIVTVTKNKGVVGKEKVYCRLISTRGE